MYDTAHETLLSKWREKNESGADTAIAVTSTHPRRMVNERRARGNGDGFNLICCKTREPAHAVHCTLHNA